MIAQLKAFYISILHPTQKLHPNISIRTQESSFEVAVRAAERRTKTEREQKVVVFVKQILNQLGRLAISKTDRPRFRKELGEKAIICSRSGSRKKCEKDTAAHLYQQVQIHQYMMK